MNQKDYKGSRWVAREYCGCLTYDGHTGTWINDYQDYFIVNYLHISPKSVNQEHH
jgi:hypothetical protein